MTRYLIEPRDQIFLKGYEFLSFAKNMGKDIGKNLSGKYNWKPLDNAKKSATYALKATSKRETQKIEEASYDLSYKKLPIKLQKIHQSLIYK